jgi:hypothetical protein|tara:strand:- start:3073 stop:3267 length:195 start_codon:yes stop_codon:yes gene_type:complete
MKIPVEGHAGLVRDTRSGAIINMSSGGQEYSVNRARITADAERLNRVEQDVSEIKDMLKQLIER